MGTLLVLGVILLYFCILEMDVVENLHFISAKTDKKTAFKLLKEYEAIKGLNFLKRKVLLFKFNKKLKSFT